jgi:hypothetical protein
MVKKNRATTQSRKVITKIRANPRQNASLRNCVLAKIRQDTHLLVPKPSAPFARPNGR